MGYDGSGSKLKRIRSRGRRKFRVFREGRGEEKSAIEVLTLLLDLIPAEAKLPITKIELAVLSRILGFRGALAHAALEAHAARLELESGEYPRSRRPSQVLGLIEAHIPTMVSLSVTARELEQLDRAVGVSGRTVSVIDLADHATKPVVCYVPPDEMVVLGFPVPTKIAAEIAGVSHREILRAVETGAIEARHESGRPRLISARSLRAYLARRGRSLPTNGAVT